ncbi:hypothetical protein AGR7B_Lc100024 [Agrobacterium deltaense RV3]|nr:hypothetical protein AGR7B_Lc100024 [Agrobacterium deltaense RV3]
MMVEHFQRHVRPELDGQAKANCFKASWNNDSNFIL